MVRMRPLEALMIKFLDELRERELPGFLPMIVELAELLGVHAELSGHLDLFVGQAMAPRFRDRPGPHHEAGGAREQED
jgi:hypothetical protein